MYHELGKAGSFVTILYICTPAVLNVILLFQTVIEVLPFLNWFNSKRSRGCWTKLLLMDCKRSSLNKKYSKKHLYRVPAVHCDFLLPKIPTGAISYVTVQSGIQRLVWNEMKSRVRKSATCLDLLFKSCPVVLEGRCATKVSLRPSKQTRENSI